MAPDYFMAKRIHSAPIYDFQHRPLGHNNALMAARRSQSFTYQPRPPVIGFVPTRLFRLYSSPPSSGVWMQTMPTVPSYRPRPAYPPLYKKLLPKHDDSSNTMTRLFFTPSRGSDVRSRASINRSSSASNIPTLCNYYNSNINVSRLSLNCDLNGASDHFEPQKHHYLQHDHHSHSKSTTNILPSIRESPGRAGVPVSRSQSFAGVTLSHSLRPFSSPPVLGDTMRRNNRSASKVHLSLPSFRKSRRVRKIPCPSRAMMMVECVQRGIAEFIQKTYEDIAQLISSENGTSTAQARLLETDKKIKAGERFLTKLEFHLAKIDEFKESYLLHQQMREGARNMAQAFSATTSNRRKDSIASIKYGYKECSQAMCAIEVELENLMGTFSCSLKGIAGFARVVPKDVFEVVIKHGDQKWKTKGRIEKDSTQRWDTPEYTFKCLVGEMLRIKASEVRAFKSVLLGQKNCEIWNPHSHTTPSNQGLFSACPQLMTVNINDHGSLKLSIIFSWNPLGNMDDSVTFLQSPIHPASSANRTWPSSTLSPNGGLTNSSLDLTGRTDSRFRGLMQGKRHQNKASVYGSTLSLPSHLAPETSHQPQLQSVSPVTRGSSSSWKTNLSNGQLRPYKFSAVENTSQSESPTSSPSALSNSSYLQSACTSSPPERTSSLSYSSPATATPSLPLALTEVTQDLIPGLVVQQMGPKDNSLTVGEALENLKTTLEDFLGHYPELQKLEQVVQVVDTLLRKPLVKHSRSSSMNLSINGAIEEAFDFLNTEELQDDFDEEDEIETGHKMNTHIDHRSAHITNIDRIIVSPSSTATTADSGIESLANCLQEDRHFGSSRGSSPVAPSSGNEQVDQALVFHLMTCDKLLQTMGNFGPLKCREIYALDHLQKQALLLEKLVAIAKSGSHVDLHEVLSAETSDKVMRELWMLCVDQAPLHIQPEKLISAMEQKFGAKLREKFGIKPIRIFHQIVARMLYVATYTPEFGRTSIVTLHQCMLYFRNTTGLTKAGEVAHELTLMDLLNTSSSDAVTKAISTLNGELPPPVCLKMLVKHLVDRSQAIHQSVRTYLQAVNKNKKQRDTALVVLVEGLEDRIVDVRTGCCVALSLLEAEECLHQLVYVSQTDSSPAVCRQAKEALYSLGDVGRKAMDDAQLTSHGFQGLHVHKLSIKRHL